MISPNKITRIFLLVFSLLFLNHHTKGQSLYPLHPSVGDTIDLIEKLDYSLLDQFPNQNFSYAIIQFNNENFEINAVYFDSLTNQKQVSSISPFLRSDIITEQKKIQKINSYYAYLATEEGKPKTLPQKKDPIQRTIRSETAREQQIKKEARMRKRFKAGAVISNEFNLFLRPTNRFLEFGQ